jgi:UDP-glucose 4-epimerase
MSNILITGGLGYIGSHFASYLNKEFKNIIIIDNLSNSNISVFNKLLILNSENKISNLHFKKCDIFDKSTIENLIEKYEIDTIAHFAGLKSVADSTKYPGKYSYINVFGTKNILLLTKKYKIKNFIFSSSATVYGNPLYLPIDENHPIRSINPYGKNKIDIENIIINDPYFQNNCSTKILRYFNPIGAHPSGLIGENSKGIPNNLMPVILKVAKGQLNKVNIFGGDYNTHDGTGVRDYIHILDLVNGHIKALNYLKQGVSIFNLGTGKGFSVLDLINTFEEVNKVSVPYEIVARRTGDVESVFADSSKAEIVLAFKAKYSLKKMCFDAWKFAQKNY